MLKLRKKYAYFEFDTTITVGTETFQLSKNSYCKNES